MVAGEVEVTVEVVAEVTEVVEVVDGVAVKVTLMLKLCVSN